MMKYTPPVRSETQPMASAASAEARMATSQISGIEVLPSKRKGQVKIGS